MVFKEGDHVVVTSRFNELMITSERDETLGIIKNGDRGVILEVRTETKLYLVLFDEFLIPGVCAEEFLTKSTEVVEDSQQWFRRVMLQEDHR